MAGVKEGIWKPRRKFITSFIQKDGNRNSVGGFLATSNIRATSERPSQADGANTKMNDRTMPQVVSHRDAPHDQSIPQLPVFHSPVRDKRNT